MVHLAIALVLVSTVLHAGWNMLAHTRRAAPMLFAHMCLWIVVLGFGPAVAGYLWHGHLLPPVTWGYAVVSGVCLSVYFLGLTQGYRAGDFTLVYPLARAVPILLLVAFDLLRGQTIEPMGYLGIFMVMGGCLFLAGNGTKAPAAAGSARLAGPALGWVLVIALGTAGYTSVDKLAMERVVEDHWMLAVQYACAQFAFAWPGLWLALRWIHGRRADEADQTDDGGSRAGWKIALIVAAGNFASYVLILLAYQLVEQASYVIAMRQFSIVIGAALGVWLLREPSPLTRLAAAVFITIGVATIVLTLAG